MSKSLPVLTAQDFRERKNRASYSKGLMLYSAQAVECSRMAQLYRGFAFCCVL